MEISTTSDIQAFIRPCCTAFGIPVPAGYVESTAKLMDSKRAHIACEQGKIVGAAGAFAHTLAVPGGAVAAAAVFGIGVLPSHRRRGILTMLQETQLADTHRRGEPIAYLWASEGAIYGRFGYGLASQTMRVTIQTGRARLRGSVNRRGDITLIDAAEAYEQIARIHNRVWKEHPGMSLRTEEWWRLTLLKTPELYCAVWEDDAYALYLVKMDTASLSGEVEILESLSVSVEGYQQIWRYLLEMDLMRVVSASLLPMDHPLLLMLEDPQKITAQVHRGVWVRIVDLKTALSSRSLGSGSVVIQVVDTLLPHNAGAWRVTREDVCRVDESPDLILGINDLGSTYLGGFTFSNLAKSGRVQERVPGSIQRADRLFSWTCKPWCPQVF